MRVGGIIRRWRVNTDLNIRDVAAEIGIMPSTLSRIERGLPMDGKTLAKLMTWLTAAPESAGLCT